MNKALAILAACGLLVVGLASLADGARTPAPKLLVRDILGPSKKVPPVAGSTLKSTDFHKAYAYCPKGWYATGGGVYSGAIREIVSAPTTDRRGWFVDGYNPDPKKQTFNHRVAVVCVKGAKPLTVRKASLSVGDVLGLERQAIASYNARSGG